MLDDQIVRLDFGGDAPLEMTLADFFHDNADGIDAEEQAVIRAELARGGEYVVGGGAAAVSTLRAQR